MRAMRWGLAAGIAMLLTASSVLGQTDGGEVGSEVEQDPLYEALEAECARIARLPSGGAVQDEGLHLLEGLDAERSHLEGQLAGAREELAASRQGDDQLNPWQRGVTKEIEDFEQQLAFLRLSRAVIDECLAERYQELVRLWGVETEPGTLRASWDKATCTDTPGVEMATAGALDLSLGEGGVLGVVRWISEPEQTTEEGLGTAGREITLEVIGAYEHDGSIQLMLVRPEALDEFRVRGKVEFTPMGLRGSGEIRYGITLEGCNIGPDPDVCVHRASCSGQWASQ